MRPDAQPAAVADAVRRRLWKRIAWQATGWRGELAVWLVAASLGALAAWLLGSERLYHWRTDLQMRSAAPAVPPAGVLVVDIDEASIRTMRTRFGPWPFGRDAYALLGGYLFDAGARAVVFDILFADERPGDDVFRTFLANAPGPVVLAAASASASLGTVAAVDGARGRVSMSVPVGCRAEQWPALSLPVWAEEGAIAGGDALGASRLGMISLPLDDDGVLRGLPLLHAGSGELLPVLPLAAWLAVNGLSADRLHCLGGTMQPGDGRRWPIDPHGRLLPPFPSAEARPHELGFGAVMRAALGAAGRGDEAALRERIRGRVVVVGASAGATSGIHGVVLTPSGQQSAAAVFATTYAALENGDVYRAPRAGVDFAWLLLTLLPAVAAARRRTLAPSKDLAWSAVALGLLFAGDMLAVVTVGQLSTVAWPVFTLAMHANLSALRWRGAQSMLQGRLVHEREAAQQASALKSEFLAHMSHEIRTPMNALLGSAELLAASPLDAQQRRHVELFRAAGSHLMEILNDLLDLSKIEAGQLDLSPRPFSLSQLVASQVALFEARAAQKGLALRTATDPELPDVVIGDPKRLTQVLRNLMSNAVKFTTQGSVTLAVARLEGDRLRFEVRDSGIGIPAARLDAIFQPFTQSDSSITRRYGGTGLGLAISKRLVELMGGRIDVASEEERGTRFGFELLLPPTDEPPVTDWDESSPGAFAMPRTPLRVLLADDNRYNVLLVQAFLEDGGHKLDVVGDGASAVRRQQRHRYDVVLMDVQMPQMDGYAATEAIRADERTRGRTPVPIIALTANAQPGEADTALRHGCSDYLAKPFTRVQLLTLLARHTGASEAELRSRGLVPTSVPPVLASTMPVVLDDSGDPRIARLASLPGQQVENARRRLADRPGLYERVLDEAGAPLRHFDQRLDEAIARGDLRAAARQVHDLKGLAHTIGATALADAAKALEQGLRRQVMGEPLEHLRAAVTRCLAHCLEALSIER